ncbi:amino acid permease/ SLC12A domain-containing protein [Sphaerosporella brunnea]|uniref:Amino acid permease/ SLC12A domain-containing protein n=1 Tax=Sphaerosporella brunnea TaxID=1250544 RepID=A0A5J5EMU2_9PEZI|nr:amino acid permease/ SLC12A domain-containing protein [Sphaerosporella brunnea]
MASASGVASPYQENANAFAARGGVEKKEEDVSKDHEFGDLEGDFDAGSSYDTTKRKLKPRHIQLMGIGGTIGTALFVQIGRALMKGGPASLFLAFTFWCTVILAVNNAISEMVTFMPITSPFVRFAARFVDESFGVAAGWNFFIFEAALVPFEIVACTQILDFWGASETVPTGAIIAICIFLYAAINSTVVKYYGESEFWLALGKMLLIIGLLCFTFITMVGGNPKHDAYGFRYWKNPGAFAEHYETGGLGKFMGLVACLIQASFTIAGPDYVAISAGEAEDPRRVMPAAFKAVTYRLAAFFVLGSLAIGVVVPYNDPEMVAAFGEGKPGAAASPYVLAMTRLGISGLPHLVNALVLTAAFSAGNSYVYCSSRCLYGLALDGHAPKFFTRCTKHGIPIYAVLVSLGFGLLSFLQLSNSASVVLSWFISLVTASQLINFSVMSISYLCFRRALAAQGIARDSLPHTTYWQPYTTYFALLCTGTMCIVGGYEVFLPGNWNVPTFLFSYTMIAVFPAISIGWKIVKRTEMPAPEDIDLFTEERAIIDAYEKKLCAF